MPKGNQPAERRINSIGAEVEFRNQQAAGSIPAGGSSRLFSKSYEPDFHRKA
jgi:hypothetical protein